jgi:hypothetical protein
MVATSGGQTNIAMIANISRLRDSQAWTNATSPAHRSMLAWLAMLAVLATWER